MVIAPIPRGKLKTKMEEEKLAVDFTVSMSACAALLWFSKPTGFQDSEPGVGCGLFGAVTWADRCCRRLS